jgi:predicted phage tail protein
MTTILIERPHLMLFLIYMHCAIRAAPNLLATGGLMPNFVPFGVSSVLLAVDQILTPRSAIEKRMSPP